VETAAHLLIVDDDERIRGLLARFLMRAGFLVTGGRDAGHARRLLAGLDFDLIVLDVMMPRLDGFALAREVRRLGRAVPILMLTAKGRVEDRVRGLDSGADDYLVKPFTVRELLARIAAVLRRSDGDVASTVAIGSITIDFPARSASRDGRRVPLTAQEFAVLGHLARHRGRLVTRGALEELLHPGESPPEGTVSNVVDVIVLRLRKKLGHDLIATRRGLGFIIDG